jgi:YHS domain-containing protein
MKMLTTVMMALAIFTFAPNFALATECGGHEQHANNPALRTGNVAKDPVCGMDVKIVNAKYVYEYKGEKYYFCQEKYLEQFKADPEKYLEQK